MKIFDGGSPLAQIIAISILSLLYVLYKYLANTSKKKLIGIRSAKNENEEIKIKYLKEQFEKDIPSLDIDYDKHLITYDSISLEIAPPKKTDNYWRVFFVYVDNNNSSVFDMGKENFTRREKVFSISDFDLEKSIQNEEILSIKIDVVINGSGQISQINDFGFEVSIPKPKLLSLLEKKNDINLPPTILGIGWEEIKDLKKFQGVYFSKNVNEAIEIIKKYSINECVIVERFGNLTMSENMLSIEKINIQTINSSEPRSDLNKSYLKKGIVDKWSKVTSEEYDSIISKINIEQNANATGFDIYDINYFDLELELKTGY